MAGSVQSPGYATTFDPQTGELVEIAQGIARVTAPNRGPFTFTGTNTFILGEQEIAVVDPGPADEAHFAAVERALAGRVVEAVLLTHTHKDHSGLARRFADAVGAPLWFEGAHRPSRRPLPFETDWVRADSSYGLQPDRRLIDGERFTIGGLTIEVVATPGHCANHLCFGIAGTPVLLSGDHVMGWNSTMIAVPDGSMADYFASLDKVAGLPYRTYLPAHGGPIEDGPAFARSLKQHREMRNAEVIRSVREGARTIGDLQQAMYPGLDLVLVPAARMTLRAHAEYLADRGEIRLRHGLFGLRLGPVG
jgi:glyoxylase-like metal-dependent hydrolase (beta-lactamase superfamily II)